MEYPTFAAYKSTYSSSSTFRCNIKSCGSATGWTAAEILLWVSSLSVSAMLLHSVPIKKMTILALDMLLMKCRAVRKSVRKNCIYVSKLSRFHGRRVVQLYLTGETLAHGQISADMAVYLRSMVAGRWT